MVDMTEPKGARLQEFEEVRARLQAKLPELLAETPILAAYLYGSVVRSETLPRSDVDIAIVFEPDCELSAYERMNTAFDIAERIEKGCGIAPVDVRGMDRAPLPFQGTVLTEGVLVYSRDDDLRADFEVLTRSKYFDFLPVIRQMQDAMIERIRTEGLLRHEPK